MMQLRAWLVDSEPEVWRRLVLDPRLTLEQLHTVLQHAFGWTNSHMHQFHEKDGTCYARPALRGFDPGFGPGKPTIDERKILLADVFDHPKKTIAYEYDFGDSWVHAVRFEKMVEGQALEYPGETFVAKGTGVFSGKERTAICLAGARNGPPEDCGGIYGYQHILDLKAKPPHKTATKDADDRELLEWIGDWDPDSFDVAEVNQLLGRLRVKKAHKG